MGWVLDQAVGQRFQSGFACDLGAGAALLLVGQVQIFQSRFAVGSQDVGAQRVAEFALVFNAGKDGCAAIFHLAQIGQPCFQIAQLGVIQPAGHFLAVAGDEGHAGTFVQQPYRGQHLRGLRADFRGNSGGNFAGDGGGKLGHAKDKPKANGTAIFALFRPARKLDRLAFACKRGVRYWQERPLVATALPPSLPHAVRAPAGAKVTKTGPAASCCCDPRQPDLGSDNARRGYRQSAG